MPKIPSTGARAGSEATCGSKHLPSRQAVAVAAAAVAVMGVSVGSEAFQQL